MNGIAHAIGAKRILIASLVLVSLSAVADELVPEVTAPPQASVPPQASASQPAATPPAEVTSPPAAASLKAAVSSEDTTASAEPASGSKEPEFSYSYSVRPRTETEKEPETVLAVRVSFSPSAFGKDGVLAGRSESTPMGVTVGMELQPSFLRSFGTVGIGPVISAFPFSPEQERYFGLQSVWSAGFEARYRLHYDPGQVVVPSVGYQYARLNYSLANGQQSAVDLQGPVIGAEFLLTSLDSLNRDAAGSSDDAPAVYLSVEMRALKGADGILKVSTPGWYFGIGIEL